MENAVQDFLQHGPCIYRHKHLVDTGDGWKHRNTRLETEQIGKALQGKAKIGYYGASVSDCVALDLDDHTGEAWGTGGPSPRLEHLYRSVCAELTMPSLVYKSPHGIHTYYKLEALYPSPILTRLATAKTIKHGAEVRPTMRHGLRFPRLVDRLDPETLAPVPDMGLQDIPVRFAGELFGMAHTDTIIREQVREQSGGARGLSAQAGMIARVERKVLQDGLRGASNDALCHLAPVYYLAGLTLALAVYRFSLLTREAGYAGELENENRLRQRMASLYRGIEKNGFLNTERARLQIEPGLFDEALIAGIVKQAPFAKQREKPLFRFMRGLFDWLNYQDAVMADPGSLAVWNYLYPYHRHNLRHGWYPFPSSLLNRLNGHYETIMPYLVDAGFLTPAPFKYQIAGRTKDGKGWQGGVCKHYAVNRAPGAFS